MFFSLIHVFNDIVSIWVKLSSGSRIEGLSPCQVKQGLFQCAVYNAERCNNFLSRFPSDTSEKKVWDPVGSHIENIK